MIILQSELSGACLSCGRKSENNIYKITAENSSGLKWSLTLCEDCLNELSNQIGGLGKIPRRFKCEVGAEYTCNTCKHKGIPFNEDDENFRNICKPCMENDCPVVDANGSCVGCKWEAK